MLYWTYLYISIFWNFSLSVLYLECHMSPITIKTIYYLKVKNWNHFIRIFREDDGPIWVTKKKRPMTVFCSVIKGGIPPKKPSVNIFIYNTMSNYTCRELHTRSISLSTRVTSVDSWETDLTPLHYILPDQQKDLCQNCLVPLCIRLST